uniref:Uncharacterized protein n=1 Tax=Thermosporothrix sp. COM3 TaxID=2490863 RepID=A0A455SGE3_9CHLR|nr:hypothetical protein KTC_11690 [Thermosporothrix sp. COM3]
MNERSYLASQRGRWFHFPFDLKQMVSWTWVLPLCLIIVSLVHTQISYRPPMPLEPPQLSSSEITEKPKEPERTAKTPDYATELRTALERFFPLVAGCVALPVFSEEWRYGMLAQVTLRRSLRRVLSERLLYVLCYLLLVVGLAGWISYAVTEQPPAKDLVWPWPFEVLWTVFPTAFLLVSLGLLVTLLSCNLVAGYLLVGGYWVCNEIITQSLKGKNALLAYTLLGWQKRASSPDPVAWFQGKGVLLLIACLLFACILWMLGNESRFIRYIEE